MAKLSLTRVTSANQPNVINSNYDLIEAAMEITLSRDGTVPNTMSMQLDMNGEKIISVGAPEADTDAATKGYVDALTGGGGGGLSHTSLMDIGTNTHAQIDTHIADATLHFTEASIDHTAIMNIGTNSHAQIDTHIADATLHFTEGSIDHTAITNIGTNSHAQIDTHIAESGTDHLPDQTGHANEYLQSNGTTADWAALSQSNTWESAIVGTSPPGSTNQHDIVLKLVNSGDTEDLVDIGFIPLASGGEDGNFFIRSYIHGNVIRFQGEDGAGTMRNYLSYDASARTVSLYYNNSPTFIGRTTNDGWDVRPGSGTGACILNFESAAAVDNGWIGYGGVGMRFHNAGHGTNTDITGENVSGLSRNFIICDPDADIKLYYDGAEVARTDAVGDGGFEVDNQATGSGFERVLTVSDNAGAASSDEETVTTASPALAVTGTSVLDSSSNAITATLGSATVRGTQKLIVMSDATNSSTVSVTNHATSDPEVFTFDAVDEWLLLIWTGTEWDTVAGDATV